MKKRVLATVLCVMMALALLPGRARAIALNRTQIFVSQPSYHTDNSVKSLDIQYTYPFGQATSQKCNVVLSKDIGFGESLFRTYGSRYSSFQDSLDAIGGVVTYDANWTNVSAGQTVNTTANFTAGTLPLTTNKKYYVYMWAEWSSHFYPDELLAILEVKDGQLYYTTDVDGGSGDIPVTEHQTVYTLHANNKEITETCAHCSRSKTLTLSANNAAYSNAGYSGAQLSDTTGFLGTVGDIKYYSVSANGAASGGTPLSSAPANVGYYYATVTLGDKTAVAPFTISLESHTITASPAALSFATRNANYTSAPAAQTVTVTNTGNSPVTLNQPVSADYAIGALSRTQLGTTAADKTATFTVRPKTGLGAGAYNTPIMITTTNQDVSAQVTPSFTVNGALSLTITPKNTFFQGEAPNGLLVTVGKGTAVKFSTDFASATLNGETIRNGEAFDGEDGSIVLRFRRDYLNTLIPGRYTLRVTITGGAFAEGTIIVTAPGEAAADVPKTGDNTPVWLLIGVAALSGLGLAIGRRKREA